MNANTNSASPSEPLGSDVDLVINPVLDPVDWEARYQAGDTPWDEGSAAPALTEFLSRHPILGEVLVPGSGPGHDVRALATQGPSARITGLDLSAAAIALARSLSHSPADASGEHYMQGNLFNLPESWHSRFDWVVEHTCFCAIPPALRSDYVRAITSVLKPSGHYFAIFYLNPAAPGGPPHKTSREEIRQLFAADFELLEEWLPKDAFEGREGREICHLWRKSYKTISL
jgi:SAM-dependent methyltransferase